jgi:hypothetical protein
VQQCERTTVRCRRFRFRSCPAAGCVERCHRRQIRRPGRNGRNGRDSGCLRKSIRALFNRHRERSGLLHVARCCGDGDL